MIFIGSCVWRRTGVSKLKKNPLGFDIWRRCPNHHAFLLGVPFTAPAGVDIKVSVSHLPRKMFN